MKDWLMELCPEIAEWQAEIIAEQVRIRVKSEREACAKLVFQTQESDDEYVSLRETIAVAIRARGE
jgi:hypothetical protein